MAEPLENLAFSHLRQMEYPGRIVAFVGHPEDRNLAIGVYGVTGRSPSSKFRELPWGKGDVIVRVDHPPIETEEQQGWVDGGNPALIYYDAIEKIANTLVVTNGRQTSLIAESAWSNHNPTMVKLEDALMHEHVLHEEGHAPVDVASYEPDAPTYTPRVSGIIDGDRNFALITTSKYDAAVHGEQKIFERPDRNKLTLIRRFRSYATDRPWNVLVGGPLREHNGMGIMTYEGHNVPRGEPIPSFVEPYFPVDGTFRSAKQAAQALWDALAPQEDPRFLPKGADVRVGVAAVVYNMISGRVREAAKIDHRGMDAKSFI